MKLKLPMTSISLAQSHIADMEGLFEVLDKWNQGPSTYDRYEYLEDAIQAGGTWGHALMKAYRESINGEHEEFKYLAPFAINHSGNPSYQPSSIIINSFAGAAISTTHPPKHSGPEIYCPYINVADKKDHSRGYFHQAQECKAIEKAIKRGKADPTNPALWNPRTGKPWVKSDCSFKP
jgi:hypothetical protein